jgi:hypothetical protein
MKDMTIITLKTEDGDTIDVRRSPNGKIEVKHSRIAPKGWAEFLDLAGSHKGKEPVSFVKLRGEQYILDGQEASLIRNAINRAQL